MMILFDRRFHLNYQQLDFVRQMEVFDTHVSNIIHNPHIQRPVYQQENESELLVQCKTTTKTQSLIIN